MIKYMSEKYYREINTNKDLVKFKLQLGAILLKLNELDLSIKNNDKDITKINTDIKDNDKDVKSNYDICTGNSNSLTDVDRKIYAINNNITKINTNITNINSDIENIEENNENIIKHNYAIENIWFYNIDILNTYTITSSKISLFEYIIEGKFIKNSILEINSNILYKYGNYNNVGLLKHIYSLIDANDNLIYTNNIIHTNSGDNYSNHLTMNDTFPILFKNSHTPKLKIKLQIGKVDTNNSKTVGIRIMNPYNNNILSVKHIKYLSEK